MQLRKIKEENMLTPKVLLATITAELPRYYEYYDSRDKLITPPNTDRCSAHSSSPARNRNEIIKAALASDYTHIFFTDDDHVYPPDTLMKLLAHNVDVVSGLYCQKFPPFNMIAFDQVNSNNECKFTDMALHDPNGLMEVKALPAGCLLVKTEVFKKITPPWFTLGHIHADEWGDDLWFCKLINDAGIKMHIDNSVRVGHMAKCLIIPNYVDGKWIIEYKINT